MAAGSSTDSGRRKTMVGSNILTPGLSGGRQGVMKEKIVGIVTVKEQIETAYSYEKKFDDSVNELISKGYQPMPNTFSYTGNIATIVMMKTEMKVEMI